MISHGKHFTLYSHTGGPNGWKVVLVLEELGLSYETVYLDFDKKEHKAAEYTKLNPNGRVPTLIDHKNNDFVIWESVAIMIYLVDKYDVDHKISVVDDPEKYTQLQWLLFQASGQGPYYGQSGWFKRLHPEKVQTAIDRYNNEIRRVLGVLDSVLAKQEYLVSNKVTIADLSFIPWNYGLTWNLGDDWVFEKEFPAAGKWHNKLLALDSVKKTFEIKKLVQSPIIPDSY